MSFEIEELVESVGMSAPVRGTLPSGLILVEAAIVALREWLDARDEASTAWPIFRANIDVYSVERHAADGAKWEPLPALSTGGAALATLFSRVGSPSFPMVTGLLALPGFEIAIARWHWINSQTGDICTLVLTAASSVREIERLEEYVHRKAHEASVAVWQIVRGSYVESLMPARPEIPRDALFLQDALAERLEREVIGFFTPAVAEMYRSLGVPHRRGVLLYGPPGNGKTSTVRYLGGRLPGVAALILRPGAGFSTDDLEEAIGMWTSQAPAMLVIEDLNWLLERVEVSAFLNLLDGIDTPDAKGLLLIASTNHPDRLDAALSNRPGRFDVVVEVPLPDQPLRLRYLRKQLPTIEEATLVRLANEAEGLSFAHLGEVLRISGLAAIAAGRVTRSEADLFAAFTVVRDANHQAEHGFAKPPSFGLHNLVRSRG